MTSRITIPPSIIDRFNKENDASLVSCAVTVPTALTDPSEDELFNLLVESKPLQLMNKPSNPPKTGKTKTKLV